MSTQRALQGEQPAGGAVGGGRGNIVFMLAIVLIVIAMFIASSSGRSPLDTIFINPLANLLILFNNIFFDDFGLAIILFTLFLRLLTLPLTVRQFQTTKAMQAIAPKQQEIQKKYKDPKRRQEEMLKLYRDIGFNPLGCLFPLVIQFGVFFALYRALIFTVGGTPESVVSLSQRLYPWSYLYEAIPLEQHFLIWNLGRPDSTLILPIMVGVTTYLQQKLMATPPTTPQQQQQMQMMNWMMPLFLVFITLNLPSGVSVYWVASGIFSIVSGYFVFGRRGINWRQVLLPFPPPAAGPSRPARPAPKPDAEAPSNREPVPASASTPSGPEAAPEKRSRHGRRRRRGKRKDR